MRPPFRGLQIGENLLNLLVRFFIERRFIDLSLQAANLGFRLQDGILDGFELAFFLPGEAARRGILAGLSLLWSRGRLGQGGLCGFPAVVSRRNYPPA